MMREEILSILGAIALAIILKITWAIALGFMAG